MDEVEFIIRSYRGSIGRLIHYRRIWIWLVAHRRLLTPEKDCRGATLAGQRGAITAIERIGTCLIAALRR